MMRAYDDRDSPEAKQALAETIQWLSRMKADWEREVIAGTYNDGFTAYIDGERRRGEQ